MSNLKARVPDDYDPSDMGIKIPNINDPCPSLEEILAIIKAHCKIDRRYVEHETAKCIPMHGEFMTYKAMAEKTHNRLVAECDAVRVRREAFYRGKADASEYIRLKWNRAIAKTKLDVDNYFVDDIEVQAADEAVMNSRIRLDVITDFIKDNINWRGQKLALFLEARKFEAGLSPSKK